MQLALFDLDNTLIAGDSDVLWMEFLVEEGLLGPDVQQKSEDYYHDYEAGRLDILAFLRFQLAPLSWIPEFRLEQLRERFIQRKIEPILLPAAFRLIDEHRQRGHRSAIITATNRFVTSPIARLFGISDLLATEVERVDGKYTGNPLGVPCFKEGKLTCLHRWLEGQGSHQLESWAYSDSRNDIPLLEWVTHPTAVDPDSALEAHARRAGWRIISLR